MGGKLPFASADKMLRFECVQQHYRCARRNDGEQDDVGDDVVSVEARIIVPMHPTFGNTGQHVTMHCGGVELLGELPNNPRPQNRNSNQPKEAGALHDRNEGPQQAHRENRDYDCEYAAAGKNGAEPIASSNVCNGSKSDGTFGRKAAAQSMHSEFCILPPSTAPLQPDSSSSDHWQRPTPGFPI